MKLSETDLERFHNAQEEFAKAKMTLGDLELSKQKVFKQVEVMQEKFKVIENEMIEKYGEDSTINMKTGEVTPKAKQ